MWMERRQENEDLLRKQQRKFCYIAVKYTLKAEAQESVAIGANI